MDFKHTPGNWEVFREQRSRVYVRAMPRDADLAVLGGPAICQVFAGPVGDRQAADNALLISAAPELYAAARAALNWINNFGEHAPTIFGGESELAGTLGLAIAKAEGEL